MIKTSPAIESAAEILPTKALAPLTGVVFSIILGLSFVLRVDGFRDDLWVDELHTAWVVNGDWSELISRAAIGNQSPLYFVVIKLVTQVFGLSEFSLRAVSLTAGMALVWTSWHFTWRTTHDRACGLIAATLVGMDSSCVFYSSEARPYAVMQLALAWLAILSMTGQSNWKRALGCAMLAAVAVHLQFTSILFLVPLYLARLVRPLISSTTSRRRDWTWLAVEVAAIAILITPLIPQGLEIGSRGEAWATFVPAPSWETLRKLFPWTPLAIGLMGFAGAQLIDNEKARLSLRSAWVWLTWSSLAPVALALLIAISGLAPVFYRRYSLGALWPLLMIPGMALAPTRGRWKAGMGVLIVVAMIWESGVIAPEVWKMGRLTRSRGESWRLATEEINQVDPRGELPLFVVAGFIESRRLQENSSPLLQEYCSLPVRSLYRVSQSDEKIEAASSVIPYAIPPTWLERTRSSGGGIWLLRVRASGAEAWGRFGNRFVAQLNQSEAGRPWEMELRSYPGVTVLRIQRRTDSRP